MRADDPEPFGYKGEWVAFRTTDQAGVVDASQLHNPRPTTWRDGVDAAHSVHRGRALVTPALNGEWILVVGGFYSDAFGRDEVARTTALKARLAALSRRFGEVQAFASSRIVDYYSWILARDGEVVRSFAWSAEDGLLDNSGELTPVEQGLSIFPFRADDLDGDAGQEEWGAALPGEDDVITVAAAWSLDPLELGPETECEGPPLLAEVGHVDEPPAGAAGTGCLLGWLLPFLGAGR